MFFLISLIMIFSTRIFPNIFEFVITTISRFIFIIISLIMIFSTRISVPAEHLRYNHHPKLLKFYHVQHHRQCNHSQRHCYHCQCYHRLHADVDAEHNIAGPWLSVSLLTADVCHVYITLTRIFTIISLDASLIRSTDLTIKNIIT